MPGVVLLLLLPLDLLLQQMLLVVEGIRVEGWRGGILGRGRASAEVLLLLTGARGVESGRSIRGRRRRGGGRRPVLLQQLLLAGRRRGRGDLLLLLLLARVRGQLPCVRGGGGGRGDGRGRVVATMLTVLKQKKKYFSMLHTCLIAKGDIR